jgi:CelD/BcsL family acetyltransferase involved in cellulose biosynthesis
VPSPDMTVQTVDGFDDFCALQPEWQELHEQAVRPSTYLTHAWLRLSWQLGQRPRNSKLRAVLVRDAGRLMMAGVFVLSRRGITPTAAFLTSELPQTHDVLWRASPYVAEYAKALLTALRPSFLPRRLRTRQVPEASPLRSALLHSSPYRRLVGVGQDSYLSMADHADYAGYLASLSAQLRKDHERRLRRLTERDDFSITEEHQQSSVASMLWLFDAKRRWLEDKDHSASWLASGYIDRFMVALLDQPDAPRASVLTLRLGTIAAAVLVFRERDTMLVSKIAYDPAFSRESPGRTLMLKLIELCFAEGYAELNMGQMADWKHRLQPSLRQVMTERAWL